MNLLETFRTGLEAVVSRRLRSGLTVLGIMIGIAAVILTVGLGEGAQQQVSSEITALGSNLLTISPGSTTSSSGIRGGFGSASTLTVGDATAPVVEDGGPRYRRRGSHHLGVGDPGGGNDQLDHHGGRYRPVVADRAGTVDDRGPVHRRARSQHPGRRGGAGIDHGRGAVRRRDAIGQSVTINGVPMTVIGVLNTVGSSGGSSSSTTADQDDQAIVPITTAATQLFGGTSRNSVGEILVQATSSSTLSAAYQEANAELLSLHAITTPPMPTTPSPRRPRWSSTATSVDKTLTVLLGRHRRHLTAGRRDRRDEHHAGVGDRTHPRDRSAQGARGHAAGHPPPVPGGGVGARPGRGHARAPARAARRLDPAPLHLRPHHHLGGGHGRSHRRWPWASGWPSASIRPSRAAKLPPIDALRSE